MLEDYIRDNRIEIAAFSPFTDSIVLEVAFGNSLSKGKYLCKVSLGLDILKARHKLTLYVIQVSGERMISRELTSCPDQIYTEAY